MPAATPAADGPTEETAARQPPGFEVGLSGMWGLAAGTDVSAVLAPSGRQVGHRFREPPAADTVEPGSKTDCGDPAAWTDNPAESSAVSLWCLSVVLFLKNWGYVDVDFAHCWEAWSANYL